MGRNSRGFGGRFAQPPGWVEPADYCYSGEDRSAVCTESNVSLFWGLPPLCLYSSVVIIQAAVDIAAGG